MLHLSKLFLELSAFSSALAAVQFSGVNEAGLEFGMGINGPAAGSVPGKLGQQFFAPNPTTVKQLASTFSNMFRLPFMWERLQPTVNGPLDAAYLALLDDALKSFNEAGAVAVLDVHNYARYNGQLLGSAVPASALANMWTQLARHYGKNQNVWFALMNEPHGIDTKQWFSVAQESIDAIRKAGATNTLTVPGNCFTGAHNWVTGSCDPGVPNAVGALAIKDPQNNFVFEVHQYLDSDFSGTHADCTQDGKAVFADLAKWLRENKKKALVGEMGVGANANCAKSLDDALTFLDQNSDVFVGYTAWAAGSAWGDYILSLEPGQGGVNKPQIAVLAKHKGSG